MVLSISRFSMTQREGLRYFIGKKPNYYVLTEKEDQKEIINNSIWVKIANSLMINIIFLKTKREKY